MIGRARGATMFVSAAGLVISLAGCSASSNAHPPGSESAKRYLAIAEPANRALDRSFDALEDDDSDLAASSAELKTIAATERAFDRDLLALRLPGPAGARARALVRSNKVRADVSEQAATAASLARLHRYEVDLDALNVPVEVEVRALRRDLGLPGPDAD